MFIIDLTIPQLAGYNALTFARIFVRKDHPVFKAQEVRNAPGVLIAEGIPVHRETGEILDPDHKNSSDRAVNLDFVFEPEKGLYPFDEELVRGTKMNALLIEAQTQKGLDAVRTTFQVEELYPAALFRGLQRFNVDNPY